LKIASKIVFVENALRSVTFARRLRKTMTRSEVSLWNALRGKQLDGLRFRRQHPLGPYVVDFFCASLKLAVEVDGSVHDGEHRSDKDAVRDQWIQEAGICVVRVPDHVVLADMDAALRVIGEAARALRPQ